MAYEPKKHHRRSIRLRGYNYLGGGTYFITVCVQGKECLFGQVADGKMIQNEVGQVIQQVWETLPRRFPSVVLDAFQIMPNHLHGVFVIPGPGLEPSLAAATGVPAFPVGWGLPYPRANCTQQKGVRQAVPLQAGPAMGDVVGALKSIATIEVNRFLSRTGRRLLQENFYEHIIRSVGSLEKLRAYIKENPARWLEDPENPQRTPGDRPASEWESLRQI